MLPKDNECTIRCADLGDPSCPWESAATSDDELMRRVEEHGRENHNWAFTVEEMKDKVKNAIRKIAA